MSVAMIFAVAGLVATGTFLVTSRSLSRIVLGFALLGHAAVLALLASGGRAGSPPIVDGESTPDTANPLPQALSLTAIVISFGLTLFVLALARRQQVLTGDDLVEDDVEDRRIATTHEVREAAVDETRELETLHEFPEGGS
ncbi:MAG TPA: NADH-quinone oxidoreductase subunit K [Ilumatobacteraceae bacterium]|nr:NADH-quinone oxidoreductase subunit K [Ilumatobacteraceae bacterium]